MAFRFFKLCVKNVMCFQSWFSMLGNLLMLRSSRMLFNCSGKSHARQYLLEQGFKTISRWPSLALHRRFINLRRPLVLVPQATDNRSEIIAVLTNSLDISLPTPTVPVSLSLSTWTPRWWGNKSPGWWCCMRFCIVPGDFDTFPFATMAYGRQPLYVHP